MDGINYKSGKITEDFEGFYIGMVDPEANTKPTDWDDRPYIVDEALQERLARMDPYMPDPDEEIPPFTNVGDWEPRLVVNPEYERLYE